MAWKIWTYSHNKNAQKALIAAEFVGVEIEEPPFEWGVTNESPEFKKLTVIGKVPVLVTPKGSIFESNAIARYVARQGKSNLFGADDWEHGQVDQWVDFASNELGAPLMAWAGPVCGYGEYKEEEIQQHRKTAERGLAALEKALMSSTAELRLVGGGITLADIITFCECIVAWQCVLAPDVMKPFPTVSKYIAELAKVKQFHSVVGDVEQAAKVPTGSLSAEENPFEKKAKSTDAEHKVSEEDKIVKKANTDA